MTIAVHTQHLVTILGSGEASAEDIDELLTRAPILVAADGGADRALELGHLPHAVIGDFDSLSSDAQQRIPQERLHRIAEQESTDFEKCLRSIDAPLILATGVTGPRIDHALAAFSILARNVGPPCILVGADDIVFSAPKDLALDLPIGSRFSLFPMTEVTGRSKGLRWPIDDLEFAPAGRVGTSNEVTGRVEFELSGSGMLIIVARTALDTVIGAIRR